jgi:hypothetical protein
MSNITNAGHTKTGNTTATLALCQTYAKAGSTRALKAPIVHGTVRTPSGWSMTLDNPAALGRVCRAMHIQQLFLDTSATPIAVVGRDEEATQDVLQEQGLNPPQALFASLVAAAFVGEPLRLYVIPSLRTAAKVTRTAKR